MPLFFPIIYAGICGKEPQIGIVMCGLFGYFSKTNTNQLLHQDAVASLQALSHRGPDNAGIAYISQYNVNCFPHIVDIRDGLPKAPADTFGVLGHRRLSIIDLSLESSQPMTTETGRYTIIYNGEIYNYKELRSELVAAGVSFKTDGDTEVFLNAFAYWGVDCFKKFNGEWASVIYDKDLNKCIVSRDRFGIKPLFYYHNDSTLVFASEIKTLLATNLVPHSLDYDYLKEYLQHGDMSYSSKTAFNGILKFPKAHFVEFEVNGANNNLVFTKYWQLSSNVSNENFCPEKANRIATEYRSLLNDAVRLRMRSDVPIGISLSGGLDSSSIAYLCKQHFQRNDDIKSGHGELLSYSLVHPHLGKDECDESDFISLVVEKLGLRPVYKVPKVDEIPSSVDEIAYYYEAPPNGFAVAGTFTISAAKEEGVVVTLDGQGADEQLAGYEKYVPCYLAHLSVKSMISEAFWILWRAPEKKSVLKLLYKSLVMRAKRFAGLRVKTLNEELADSFDGGLMNLIHYSDRRSMMKSIESRMPFMDHRLVEFNASISAVYKIHKGFTKYYARLAFQDLLPDEIIWREDKYGWNTPEKTWLEGKLKHWSDNLLKGFDNKNFERSYLYRLAEKSTEHKVRVLNLITFHKIFGR